MWLKKKAKAPVTVTYTTDPDYAYRAAWKLSLGEWLELTDEQRRDYRDRVSYALATV